MSPYVTPGGIRFGDPRKWYVYFGYRNNILVTAPYGLSNRPTTRSFHVSTYWSEVLPYLHRAMKGDYT